jgi:hypothetical protein
LVFGNSKATSTSDPSLDNPNNFDPTAKPPNIAPASLPKLSASFPDGLENTILFAEKFSICNWFQGASTKVPVPGGNFWAPGGDSAQYAPAFAMESPWNDGTRFQLRPSPETCNVAYASTGHRTGMRVVMADGNARTLSPGISPEIFTALCTPNGGEEIAPDW